MLRALSTDSKLVHLTCSSPYFRHSQWHRVYKRALKGEAWQLTTLVPAAQGAEAGKAPGPGA